MAKGLNDAVMLWQFGACGFWTPLEQILLKI